MAESRAFRTSLEWQGPVSDQQVLPASSSHWWRWLDPCTPLQEIHQRRLGTKQFPPWLIGDDWRDGQLCQANPAPSMAPIWDRDPPAAKGAPTIATRLLRRSVEVVRVRLTGVSQPANQLIPPAPPFGFRNWSTPILAQSIVTGPFG